MTKSNSHSWFKIIQNSQQTRSRRDNLIKSNYKESITNIPTNFDMFMFSFSVNSKYFQISLWLFFFFLTRRWSRSVLFNSQTSFGCQFLIYFIVVREHTQYDSNPFNCSETCLMAQNTVYLGKCSVWVERVCPLLLLGKVFINVN